MGASEVVADVDDTGSVDDGRLAQTPIIHGVALVGRAEEGMATGPEQYSEHFDTIHVVPGSLGSVEVAGPDREARTIDESDGPLER